MSNNKTMVISVAEEFKEMIEPCTVEETADQLKRYFEDGAEDIQTITNIVKIDIVEY